MLSNMNRRNEASQAFYDASARAPFGRLGIKIKADRLAAIDLVEANFRCRVQNKLAKTVCAQLEAYFADPRYPFNLPLALPGTVFQKRVWQALRKIPNGQVLSYGELALRLGSGARAIGNACRANPIPIIIPCHRIVGKSDIGGYMGAKSGGGQRMKHWLLAHEAGG